MKLSVFWQVPKLKFDVLFFGFGPITQELVQKLISDELRVLVVSNRPVITTSKSNAQKEFLKICTWAEVIKSQVSAETSYIGWRCPPQNQLIGEKLVEWVFSPKFETEAIFHLSSASVYTEERVYFSESDFDFRMENRALNPKQQLETLVSDLANKKGIKFVNYRLSNVYGPSLTAGFINESLSNLRRNAPIRLFRNMDVVRDYLSVEDLVDVLVRLRSIEIQRENINISTGFGVAISEIVTQLKTLVVGKMEFVELEAPTHTISRSVLSCERLREVVAWNPRPFASNLPSLLLQVMDRNAQ